MSLEETTMIQETLAKCSMNTNPDAALRGHIDGTITGPTDMPLNPTPDEIIVYRVHPDLIARQRQLTINILGLEGGRPYVNARLSRFAGENEVDWIGGTRPDGSCSTGRLQQTHAFPYLGRIAGKINQHVFQEEPVRENSDELITADITRNGLSVNDLMRQVSDYLLATSWCWIGIDAPPKKVDGELSVEQKEQNKIRPFWQFYSPLAVRDWHFNAQGGLDWVKTVKFVYDDSDPSTIPVAQRVISLWERGKVTEYTVHENFDRRYASGKRVKITKEEIPLEKSGGGTLDEVPFVLCGEISSKPIPFDDLESINRTIMDLGSVDRANYFNCVYPQLILPASVMAKAASDGYAKSTSEVARLLLGFKYPILLDKDDPTPSYLTPNSGAIESIAKRIDTLKMDLFEVVGMALDQSSRQVESAASKAWDNLDVAALMKSRAEKLSDSEKKAVAITQKWDPEFKPWIPVYNTDFDVGDFAGEIQSLVLLGNVDGPDSFHQLVLKKIIDRVNKIGSSITSEEYEQILTDVAAWAPMSIEDVVPSIP